VSDQTYYAVLWIVIAGGLVPAVYFLTTWRPARRWSPLQLDAGGWVAVVAALYLLAAIRVVLGHYSVPSSRWQAIASFAVGFAIDGVIWLRALRWRSFRTNPPQRRSTDACE
jgi:hypothetical protein